MKFPTTRTTLTSIEIEALGNPARTLQDAAQRFWEITTTNWIDKESDFDRCLRVKNTLDAQEASSEAETPERLLALLVNCEYQLWYAYRGVPVKYNPFLSHWVEALQRLGGVDRSTPSKTPDLSIEQITAARLCWIRELLRVEDALQSQESTPSDLHQRLAGDSKSFRLVPYVQFLSDAGIYDRRGRPEVAHSSSATQQGVRDNGHSPREDGERSLEDTVQREKDDILQKLQKQPDAAVFAITRLPIAIPYLDFLTTLLADRTLEKHNIDPAPIITQYIQHALRIVERAEKPPSPALEAGRAGDGQAEHGVEAEYGKDAQTRYIRLLLLFIKSLIRKGLVELDVLYYEISEITVRYVWIKEVREFRTWAEEGIEEGDTG